MALDCDLMIINELYKITKEIENTLRENPFGLDREEIAEKTTSLLIKRKKIINELPKSYTPQEKKLFNEIIELNKEIDSLLNQLKNEIQSDLQDINKKKQANQKYNQILSGDGMFFDKRK